MLGVLGKIIRGLGELNRGGAGDEEWMDALLRKEDIRGRALAGGAAALGSSGGVAGLSINDAAREIGEDELSPKQKIERRTTHGDENKKWYKAAKRAEKDAGAANVHLAL